MGLLKEQLKAFSTYAGKQSCKQSRTEIKYYSNKKHFAAQKLMKYLQNSVKLVVWVLLCLRSSQVWERRLSITEVLISKHKDTDTAWNSCPQHSLHKKAIKLNCFKVLDRTSKNTLAVLHTSKINGWIMYSFFKQAIGIWESHQVLSTYPCNILAQLQRCRGEAPG